ncbi:MAG: septum formation inhibitor Maf [Cellvibrionales bacterium TMED79]|nr:septum formation inhibitor Maf [Halieaceae bacterium]OUV06437.1 MAG: septum formation inhibitor Maf [Cellvibrionales bacterium TMED79]
MRLILASASPRRRELLSVLVQDFDCLAADIDETPFSGEGPEDYVLRMAIEKARAVTAHESAVIGSDTIVVSSDKILQKPVSIDDARGMLRALSGQTHNVMTAVAIMVDGNLETRLSNTRVTFTELEHSLIEAYLATDEPWDKAGAYAIQGLAGAFVRRLEGSYSAVVGLPLSETKELLDVAGVQTRLSIWDD